MRNLVYKDYRAVLSPHIRESLHPLVFTVVDVRPDEFIYRYAVSNTDKKQTILITTNQGSYVKINNQSLEDILDERDGKETFVGYLFPKREPYVLDVFTKDDKKPVIHITKHQ
jgi:hypothetical protein